MLFDIRLFELLGALGVESFAEGRSANAGRQVQHRVQHADRFPRDRHFAACHSRDLPLCIAGLPEASAARLFLMAQMSVTQLMEAEADNEEFELIENAV